jgi:hypothetical protein
MLRLIISIPAEEQSAQRRKIAKEHIFHDLS